MVREAKMLAANAKLPLSNMARRKAFPSQIATGTKVVKGDERGSLFWFTRNDLDLY